MASEAGVTFIATEGNQFLKKSSKTIRSVFTAEELDEEQRDEIVSLIEKDALEEAKIKAETLRNQTLTNAGYDPEVFKDYLTIDDKGDIIFTDNQFCFVFKFIFNTSIL